MLSTVLEAGSYRLTAFAAATFLTAGLSFLLGGTVLLRERGSRTSRALFYLCLAVSVWLLGFSLMTAATAAEAARAWARAGFLGFPFVPPAMYHFSTRVLGIYPRRRGIVWAGWSLAAVGSVLLVATRTVFTGLRRYAWGFYPGLGLQALALCLLSASFLGLTLWELWRAHRQAEPGTAKLRARAFLLGFAVASLALVDYLPAFGVRVFPIGLLPIAAFLGIAALAIWRHRLADLTPSFVADKLIRTMPDMLIACDGEGRIRLVNPAFCSLLGYGFEELNGEPVERLAGAPSAEEALREALRLPATFDQEVSLRARDGDPVEVSLSSAELEDPNGFRVGSVILARDIRARRKMEGELLRSALFDQLTGLPNRTLLLDRLSHALAHGRSRGIAFALLYVDLHGLREVADTLGPGAADEVVTHAGRRLVASVRESDTVARLEDGYAVLLRHVIDASAGLRAARRMQKSLAPAFRVEERQISLTPTIGLAHSATGYDGPEEILRDARAALRKALEHGPGNVGIFDKEMRARAVARLRLEGDLKRALALHEFRLRFQPIVALETGEMYGYEALLRWEHSERGLVGPETFIPVAEQTGLIVEIGEWVLSQACRQVAAWREELPHLADLRVHVNLSPREVGQPALVRQVETALQRAGLAPDHLVLELTEAALAERPEVVLRTLNALRARGVHLCVDDFGTGYSSLARLHRFPIEILKIDRSFVSGSQGRSDVEIIRSIIALGEALGAQVIAEGVETEEQLALLESLGCRYGQGYLFSVPVESPGAAGGR
ncbi:MAG: putative bifunctional diguanylate cyclase/phosphodiesterase [Gemmatimonadota bacterium]